MVELVRDSPGAQPDDLVLEVRRVEDARTVTQRLRIRAPEWREFMATLAPGPAPANAQEAYRAQQDFWDWLAEAHADTPAPDEDRQPTAPGSAWLQQRYEDWLAGR